VERVFAKVLSRRLIKKMGGGRNSREGEKIENRKREEFS
jgi:hypothetical protein